MRNIIIPIFILSISLSCGQNDRLERGISRQNDIENSGVNSDEINSDTSRKNEENDSIRNHEKPPISQLNNDQHLDENGVNTSPTSHILTSTPQKTRKNPLFSNYLWTILLLLLLAGLVTAVVSLANKIKKANDEIKQLSRKVFSRLSSAHSDYQSASELKKLEEQINQLSKRIDRLAPSYGEKSEAVTVEQPVEVELQVTKREEEPVIFFMATPDKEGFFNTSSHHTSFRQGATYYKFYPSQKDENHADFEFFSDEYGIKAAANYPQTYIEPVCEPQNAQNPNAKKIITIANEKGRAEKRGDKWIVTQKAKIRYE